jgi:glycopeptide antibiotics resistance protein
LTALRKICFCLLLVYIPTIIYFTFFSPKRERSSKIFEYHFVPLESTIAQIKDPAQYDTPHYWRIFAFGLAGNFLLFLPLGFFLKVFIQRKTVTLLLYAVCISVLIELLQLVLRIGVCDIDDVMLNSAGALAGMGVYAVLYRQHIKP